MASSKFNNTSLQLIATQFTPTYQQWEAWLWNEPL